MSKNYLKIGIVSAVIIVVIAGIAIFDSVSGTGGTQTASVGSTANVTLKKVTIGFQPSPPMAILMVAKDKGFFEKQGLDVEMKQFTAGKFALAAFFGGSLDFAVSGDVPPTLAAIQGNEFVVPAQLVKDTKGEVRVVARKDGSLNDASSYFHAKKRKLATSSGGGPEFFTYELLNKLGVTKDQIEIVSQKPEDMVAALSNGSVDAISIFDPVAYFGEKALADKGVTFTDDSIYSELYVIEAHVSVKDDPATLEKLLKALIDAENYLKANPEESKDIVVKYTGLDRKAVDGIWADSDFGVSLTPELLKDWKKEVDWAKATGKVKSDATIPDMSKFIYSDILKKIAPEAVTQ